MKRVGILTFFSENTNYGSILQAYALQQVIKRQGFEVEMINYLPTPENLAQTVRQILRKMRLEQFYKCDRNFYKKFVAFKKSHFKFTKEMYGIDRLKAAELDYDYIVVGSDQVWSSGNIDDAYLLNFSDCNNKISYAASMANTELSDDKKKLIIGSIPMFRAVSMREKKGASVINELTGTKPKVALDPTLLLDEQDYADVIAKKNQYKNYCLSVFLADRERPEYSELMSRLPNKNIINLGLKRFNRNMGQLVTDASPSEFLRLVKDADYIVTDSYHVAIFSIIFKKPFYVLSRFGKGEKNNQNSRVEELMKKFGLNNRYIEDFSKPLDALRPIDYKKVYSIMEKERELSLAFLEGALDGQK